MTDLIDRANLEADAWTAERIRQITKATKGQQPNSITECVGCGEPIGEQRKQYLPWVIRCIKCQTAREVKNE